jgi:hypothetical protein
MIKKVSYSGWGVFFLFLFLGYFVSVTFFDHAHIVDGITVVHSHPYKKSPDGKPIHDHDKNEYFLIHILNHFSLEVISFLSLGGLFMILLLNLFTVRTDSFRYQISPDQNYRRGPPQTIFQACL